MKFPEITLYSRALLQKMTGGERGNINFIIWFKSLGKFSYCILIFKLLGQKFSKWQIQRKVIFLWLMWRVPQLILTRRLFWLKYYFELSLLSGNQIILIYNCYYLYLYFIFCRRGYSSFRCQRFPSYFVVDFYHLCCILCGYFPIYCTGPVSAYKM